MSDPHEIVLTDGRFASVRRMKVRDLTDCTSGNAWEFCALLATRLTLIDGKPVTLAEIMDGDYEVWRPVFKCITDQLDRSQLLQSGIA